MSPFQGTIAAFYNGVRIPYRVYQEGDPKEEWSTSAYKIYINADWKSGERMDIPSEYVSLDNYCATLGHKINHSFRPNCEEWFFDHPRFGLVPCERAKKDIKVVMGRVLPQSWAEFARLWTASEWAAGLTEGQKGNQSEVFTLKKIF